MSTDLKKVFISYSWKPFTNKEKVIDLAERLTNDGIHVILDDWDLKEGQDKYHFMEQMVNEVTVDKVLLISNKEYAKKANGKVGGVGVESLIVSDEIYNQVEQTKFIPVVMEYENGKPCLPTFIKTRIYIDLSNEEVFEENYDKLIRNIFNKPTSKRPPIGKMPIHLQDDNPIFLPTAHKVSQLKNSLISGNKNSEIFIKDYLETFIKSLLIFKLDIQKDEINQQNFIDKVELSIEQMQPLKTDFIEFLDVVAKYYEKDSKELWIDFFEDLQQFYIDNDIRLEAGNSLNDLINDNYRFFNYDLFLSFCSVLLKQEKFENLNFIYQANLILNKPYINKPDVTNFVDYRKYNYTLNEYKNQSVNPKRISVVADMLKKHSTVISFEDLKRADILNYYMSLIYPANKSYGDYWFPETSCYNSRGIDLFPKIISKRYFERIKYLFDVKNIEEFKSIINQTKEKDKIQRGFFKIPYIDRGLNLEDVGTYK